MNNQIMYYLPIAIGVLIVIVCFFRNKPKAGKILFWSNIFALLTLIYSVILGIYFKSFSFAEFPGGYPSKIISYWSSLILIIIILPLDILYLLIYLIKKRSS